MCGENRYGRVRPTRKAGSSPRVRGKLYRENAERATYGLIPACAGKTVRDKAARLNCWAHPRVCGENMPCGNTRILEGGSSPRVRGKPHSGSEHNTRRGLIPACAGKTRSDLSSYSIVWAHPRVCGENLQVSLDSFRGQGSSPRVRGKLASGRSTKTVTRLIPACAGKTRWALPALSVDGAHPRVCGENFLVDLVSEALAGSSPRVRGKPRRARAYRSGVRLIPACAGKTTRVVPTVPSVRAHPRVCGENSRPDPHLRQPLGSSPRVRGKLPVFLNSGLVRGLIPACAGKTGCRFRSRCLRRAHPRVCGENIGLLFGIQSGGGSSPRVRGKLNAPAYCNL